MEIIKKLEEISNRLDRIEKRLDTLDISCDKMNGHVDFVEGVYSTVQRPFHGIMEYIGQSRYIMGNDKVGDRKQIDE